VGAGELRSLGTHEILIGHTILDFEYKNKVKMLNVPQKLLSATKSTQSFFLFPCESDQAKIENHFLSDMCRQHRQLC
jgi:hypothetical protein